jgi:anti-sigma-K factor RskA
MSQPGYQLDFQSIDLLPVFAIVDVVVVFAIRSSLAAAAAAAVVVVVVVALPLPLRAPAEKEPVPRAQEVEEGPAHHLVVVDAATVELSMDSIGGGGVHRRSI